MIGSSSIRVTARAIAALAIFAVSPAGAQQPAAADVSLVRELLVASGGERQYEAMIDIMMESMRSGFVRGMGNALRDKPIDAEKRARVQAIAERHVTEMMRDFAAELRRIMPYEKLVTEVYAPVYLRHFNRDELGEMTAFFRSPTGRKFASSGAKLMQESSQIVTQRFVPQLTEASSKQAQERIKSLLQEIGKL